MTGSPKNAPSTRKERRAEERRRQQLRQAGSTGLASSRPIWQSPFALLSVGAIVVAVVLIVAFGAKPPNAGGDLLTPTTDWASVQVDGENAGPADAPVVIQIYSDFQCPVCGRLAKDYLPRVVLDYVRTGSVRLEARDIDILGGGTQSESTIPAVGAYCASEQGKYWQFHDYVFWNQVGENRGTFNRERMTQIADALGLDRGAFDACFADPAHAAAVQSATVASRAAGVDATPTLVMNGQLARGLPATYSELSTRIAQFLAAQPTPAASGSTVP